VNKHRDEPTIEQLRGKAGVVVAETVDGRRGFEPDAYCPRGSPSWLLKLGYI
jgi:hypothetical protein